MIAAPQLAKPILILVGPTAIGKTAMSLAIAERFGCEIVSVDSMQVYRFMDIGTAKASPSERARVRHHIIDIIDPDEQYDAARFAADAKVAIADIHRRDRIPLLTGGTGLYLRALLEGIFECLPADHDIRMNLQQRIVDEGPERLFSELVACDPVTASRIHVNDRHRLVRALEVYRVTGIPWSIHLERQKSTDFASDSANMLQIGLTCDRPALYQRINQRCLKMIEYGLEEEVRGLLEQGYRKDLPSMRSLGYRHMLNYLDKTWTMAEVVNYLARDTRRYAKRQYTWFNANHSIEWHSPEETDVVCQRISHWLENHYAGSQ
ncbi:MAG: tRNA (adenosine(37)-N6)-dimethylallyltransferase MiaA [Desulfobulbaceae bacterium]|nr:MAG: tRNA (adenosine(37)-N6)-dimethylallyltransferase MiaA [Desulfobulbaceae bacterium]